MQLIPNLFGLTTSNSTEAKSCLAGVLESTHARSRGALCAENVAPGGIAIFTELLLSL